MVDRLLDLDQRFPIVDPKTGQPTDYFMRMLLDRRVSQTAAADDIVSLAADKADKATAINTGFGLSGGGDLSADRTLALGNPALSDPGADRGVFWDDSAGKLDWLEFGSGLSLSGTTLTAPGGGGASGLGPAWTDLTFGSSGTYFGVTLFRSAESFTLAAGQRLEVEAYVHKIIDASGEIHVGDDAAGTAYSIRSQNDNNLVLYRHSGGASTSLSASGVNATYDWTGAHFLKIVINVHAASNNFLWGVHNDQKLPLNPHINNTTFTMVGTQRVYLSTSDISKCYARARIIG